MGLVNAASNLDQGNGYVNASAASALLAAGTVPDTVAPLPNANESVKVNVEKNTSLNVQDGFVRQTLAGLQPGERRDIVYRVSPNTSQVIVSLSNFAAGPVASQNQLFGDDVLLAVHTAKTSGDDYTFLDFVRTGTFVVNNPETGLIRVSVSGDWTNGTNVGVDVAIVSATDPVPQFTTQSKITQSDVQLVPFSVPAGANGLEARLSWRADWGNFPTADIDLILISPSGKVNSDGAHLNNPESAKIAKPEAGNWTALVNGFSIPAGSDKYELRIAVDGVVLK